MSRPLAATLVATRICRQHDQLSTMPSRASETSQTSVRAEYRCAAVLERPQRCFALALRPVTVDRGRRVAARQSGSVSPGRRNFLRTRPVKTGTKSAEAYPQSQRRCSSMSALRLVSTKTRVRPGCSETMSHSASNLSRSSTYSTFCVVSWLAAPTRPILTSTGLIMKSLASRWMGRGKVAENIIVIRPSAQVGMLFLRRKETSSCLLLFATGGSIARREGGGANRSMMSRIWGSNPMSSMRSASSSVRKATRSRETRPLSSMSLRRPGVATRMSQPRSIWRIWSPNGAPP